MYIYVIYILLVCFKFMVSIVANRISSICNFRWKRLSHWDQMVIQ